MSGGGCVVDRWLRELSLSQRKVLIVASGTHAEGWHPLLRDLVRCVVLDLLRVIEAEEDVFEEIANAHANTDLADLDVHLVLPDPDDVA